MATTQEIIQAAQALGKLIESHETAERFRSATEKLNQDAEARRLLNDFNRQVRTISEKEAAGKPVEVQDKRNLEQLQKQVVNHPLLRDFQTAQMDYVDLMRQVDSAIFGQATPPTQPAADTTGGAG